MRNFFLILTLFCATQLNALGCDAKIKEWLPVGELENYLIQYYRSNDLLGFVPNVEGEYCFLPSVEEDNEFFTAFIIGFCPLEKGERVFLFAMSCEKISKEISLKLLYFTDGGFIDPQLYSDILYHPGLCLTNPELSTWIYEPDVHIFILSESIEEGDWKGGALLMWTFFNSKNQTATAYVVTYPDPEGGTLILFSRS